MKYTIQVILIFLLLALLGCDLNEISDYDGNYSLSVMSFNMRYDEPADEENQWDNRKSACINMLNDYEPSILCIQEGLYNQVRYLNENLPSYQYVGVGRDDGYSGGEHAAIFYDTTFLELQENGNFWLSETPDYPSLGWDANNIRIVTWAKFKDSLKNDSFYVFNTHFDHIGKIAQQKSSELLVKNIKEIVPNDNAVFITGDFNLLISNERLEPITTSYFSAQRFAEKSDDNKSFNAFGLSILSRNIDFIFYQNARSLSYKTVVTDYDVPYISDHYPIISHFNY